MTKFLRLFFVFCCLFINISHAELIKDQVISVDGEDRTYDLYIPTYLAEKSDGNPARPLVVLLHGHFGNADVMTGENGKKAPYKFWLSIAQREGWYVAIPDGQIGPDGKRGWNDCRADAATNPKSDDVKFLNNMVAKISAQYQVDQKRVYAHGTSNGGNMAFRLALENADKFKAVAAVVASMPKNSKCTSLNRPISVLIMNGTEDPLLPYEGGAIGRREADKETRGSALSTDDAVQYWVNNNKISLQSTTRELENIHRRDRSTVEVTRYTGGSGNTEVVLYKIIGGGHTEPSLAEHYGALYKAIVGKQNRDIEMAEEVWRFFEKNQ